MAQPLPDFDDTFATATSWAAMYRACGLQVVPAYYPEEAPRGTSYKRPILPQWRSHQMALVPQATWDRWYAPGGIYADRLQMGIITGECSDRTLVIDLDIHKKPEARSWWHVVLEQENNGIELQTVEQITGGGGRQKLFRYPKGWLAPTNRTAIGVDIRGQGGFAMMPPSRHESGAYGWAAGCAPWETEILDAPEWLLDAVEALCQAHGGGEAAGPRTHTASPEADYDGWGNRTDGREHYMVRVVWAAVLDHWRANAGAMPSVAEQQLRASAAYETYERGVISRLAGVEKTADLEREGRGRSAFGRKWRAAMRHWFDRVAAEASQPRPGWRLADEAPTGAVGDGAGDGGEATGGFIPGEFGQERPEADNPGQPGQPPPATVPLLSAFPIAEADIPPRDWIVPGLLLRRHLSLLVAPPGIGKSLLTLQLAIAVATGMAWAGWTIRAPRKVLVINAEDDIDEMRRRLVAAAASMGVTQEALEGRLFLAEAPDSVVIARADRASKTVMRTPLHEALCRTIVENGIDCVIADPCAETFEGDENSNSEFKWAGILWREIARRTNAAALLVHHTRKYAGDMAGDADASRGGGALIGTARIVATLFGMTEAEADVMGVEKEDRGRYVRFDDAKANLNFVSGIAKWFEKVTVTLKNATGFVPGDEVGVLVPWKPPGLLAGVAMQTIGQALDAIDRGLVDEDGRPTGQFYTASMTGPSKDRWAGNVLMRLFGCDEDRARRVVKEWLKNDVLTEFEYHDPVSRKPRKGVRVAPQNRPDRGATP